MTVSLAVLPASRHRADGQFTLNVTIPANTTATVYVPAADSREVTESGMFANAAEGGNFLQMENGAGGLQSRLGQLPVLQSDVNGRRRQEGLRQAR